MKEDDDANENSNEVSNGDSTSDEEGQEKTNDSDEKLRDKDKHNRETKRNVPKATSTSFDTDTQETGKTAKSGRRVKSIQNDVEPSQGKSKKPSTKEGTKPLQIQLAVQSNPVRKSTFPPLIENASSPYAMKQSMSDPVKLRMSHGASSPGKRSKSRGKELEIANRGS